jgi:hypothetical protein
MSEEETAQIRPFVYTVIEDGGVNVTIEIAEEDYLADFAAGCTEDETMKPGRYVFKRGGFFERHPEFKDQTRKG